MSKKKHSVNSVVRCYEVGSPMRHQDGFTIYKVTEQIILVDALENNVQESFTWKRYSDFNKLYKCMLSLHTALHRREEFPDFVRAQLFNRFESTVIEERRRSAQDLLNFIGQRHYLVGSVAFKEFFRNAQAVENPAISTDMLQPSRVCDSSATDCETASSEVANVLAANNNARCSGDILKSNSEESSPSNDCESNCLVEPDCLPVTSSHESLCDDQKGDDFGLLGGVWLHRQGQEDVISSGDGADDDDGEASEGVSDDVDKTCTIGVTCLDKVDLSAFDSLQAVTDDAKITTVSNLELLASVETVDCTGATGEEDFGLEDILAVNGLDERVFFSSMSKSAVSPGEVTFPDSASGMRPRIGSMIESGRGDLTASPVRSSSSALNLQHIPSLLRVGASLAKAKLSLPWKSGSTASGLSDGQTEYIIEAAELISQAQEHEIANCYQAAFSKYKSGIGILLKGVQKDGNAERREAVRMKTEKYLLKAEELYHKHLSATEVANAPNRWGISAGVCETEVDASVALLRAPSEELRNFKVIGVIHGVQLVVDTSTNGTFVVKVLRKTCMESSQTTTSIVPTHLPYVVSLVKFYETNSAIYLLLQHAAGGRLWSYVGSYLNQCPDTPLAAAGVDDETFGCSPLEYSEGSVERSVENNTSSLNRSHSVVVQANGSDLPSSVHEIENLSILSISELDCTSRSQDRELVADSNLLPDSFSPNPDGGSTGFNNILMSATTEMNCFSIGSFDSASASRQTSCSSEMNPNDITNSIVSPPPSRETSVPRDITLTNVADGTNSTCVLDEELSIYDRYRPCDVVSWDNLSDPEPLPSTHDKRLDDEDSLAKSNQKLFSSAVVVTTQSQDIESNDSSSRRPTVLHVSSHDRSFESAGRKRLRTLSLTFGELDLRGAGGTTTADKNRKCSNVTRLPESCVRQWAAEMVVAISRLHSTGIICRDLSPANILLGDRGHILLTYFSQWNTVDRILNDDAINNLYCAPEVTRVFPVSPSCDWWSLGALLYELLTGQTLRICHPSGIMSHTTILVPDDLSCEAQSLLRELLRYNPSERIGGGLGGSEDLRNHPFFAGIQWNNLFG